MSELVGKHRITRLGLIESQDYFKKEMVDSFNEVEGILSDDVDYLLISAVVDPAMKRYRLNGGKVFRIFQDKYYRIPSGKYNTYISYDTRTYGNIKDLVIVRDYGQFYSEYTYRSVVDEDYKEGAIEPL